MLWKEYIVRFNRIARRYGWTVEVPYESQVIGYREEDRVVDEIVRHRLRMVDLGYGFGALRRTMRWLRKLERR